MLEFLLLLFFFLFAIILPIALFYWRIKRIDLDSEPKPIRKIIRIGRTNSLFLAIILYILLGIAIYLITKK